MKIIAAASAAQPFGYFPPGNFRPPEMDAAEISHHRAADHDVVKVGHDEIRSVKVHVGRQRGKEQARQAAHREQANEAQGVQHRRFVGDRPLVQESRSS